MGTFGTEKSMICRMLDEHGYRFRESAMQGDDFRLFLVPPGMEVESEEVFKIKGSKKVCCGSEVIMGNKSREKFLKQSKEEQEKFLRMVGNAKGVEGLDLFEVISDEKNFRILIRAEFEASDMSEDAFGDAMDRLNIAGGSIEDAWNEYFSSIKDI